jgi:uncharacterized coiled-coil protein SlyX
MIDPQPDPMEQLAARVTGLEELVTHFERSVGELDEVLRQVQVRMDTLETRFRRLTSSIEKLAEGAVGDPSAEDERPPHY